MAAALPSAPALGQGEEAPAPGADASAAASDEPCPEMLAVMQKLVAFVQVWGGQGLGREQSRPAPCHARPSDTLATLRKLAAGRRRRRLVPEESQQWSAALGLRDCLLK